MFNKEKVSKLEREVYRLKNVLKGYQKAIRQVRSEINHIKNMKGLPNV